tara:strand:- start:30650 stop:31057 length:408 start_codon:yes stop_codon:yes gene_type:complete
MLVYVLLYQVGNEGEGIHSLEIKNKTVVLMFEEKDDAERYCGLLVAQDFPSPSVESVERVEIETFCSQSGYEAKFVMKGFIPKTQEDRLLISPPQSNLNVDHWNELNKEASSNNLNDINALENLDNIKKSLEDLL